MPVGEKVLTKCGENIAKGRAPATGIGLFAAVLFQGGIVLRRRKEKDSIYGKDLSGLWELPGGGSELVDSETKHTILEGFSKISNYQLPIFNRLHAELEEEAELFLTALPEPLILLPAWLWKDDIIDLAFVVPIIGSKYITKAASFDTMLEAGDLIIYAPDISSVPKFISPRMEFLFSLAWVILLLPPSESSVRCGSQKGPSGRFFILKKLII